FHAGLIGLGPVDYSDRIIRLRIVGIQFRSLAVVLLGLFKLLHLQIQIRDSLDAVYLLFVTGMAVQNLLILLDSSFSVAIIFRSVHPGDVLLGIRGGQVEPRIQQYWVYRDGIFEVFDGLFIFRTFVDRK